MTVSTIFQLPKQTPFLLGALVPGAKAQFYAAGTTTPQSVYTTSALSVAHANPVEADAAGEFPVIYLDASLSYRVQIKTSGDVLIYDQDNINDSDSEPTAAEAASGLTIVNDQYPPGHAWRYGILPNDAGLATANTTILNALLEPTVAGYKGTVLFPGLLGDDTYFFDDRIAVRDGIEIDGCHTTFYVTKTGEADDTNGAFLHALRHFTLKNVKIEINYTYVTGTNAFNAIALGGRDATAVDWHALWDAEESEPFGNITIQNVEIDYTGGAYSKAIYMLGGLQNCLLENIRIKGNDTLDFGIGYEFGFATSNATANLRESSHMHNAVFKNIYCEGLAESASGAGLRLAGAYNVSVIGYKQIGGNNGIVVGPGEALFYRPWAGVDDIGTSRWINIESATFSDLEGNALDFAGASANTGYLSGLTIDEEDLTDLYSVTVDGFLADFTNSTGPGFGVNSSCGHTNISNGHILAAAKGIVLTNEAVMFDINNVDVYDSDSIGMQIGLDSNIFSPKRRQIGSIRNSHIAGSGSNSGIVVDNAEMVTVSTCRFGYETNHDGKSETTQTGAINCQGTAVVRAVDNFVAGVASGNAYLSATGAKGILVNPRGIRTASSLWRLESSTQWVSTNVGDANKTLIAVTHASTQRWTTALTANRTVTLSTSGALHGDKFRVVRTGLGAFTLNVGGLKTIPASTAAWVDVEYTGSAWILTGYGTL